MVEISRRTLLLGGGAVAAVAATGAISVISVSGESAIVALVRRCVPGLPMDRAALHQFARDAAAHLPVSGAKRKAHLALMRYPLLTFATHPVTGTGQARLERWVITKFMMSTDFFQRDDHASSVTYLGFADPYERADSNILAEFSN